jgi:hypothetical protein
MSARTSRPSRAPALLLIAALVAVATTACDRAPANEPGVTRADSVGVRLITNAGADTTLPWTFEEVGVLRDTTGEDGDSYIFTRLWRRGVITDRAGRTYVLTRDPSILRFGRDGRLERAIGRQGGGPGEMQLPAVMGVQGDTIFVLDLMKRALVRWSPTFDPIGDQRLEGALERANDIAFRTGGLWYQEFAFTDSSMRITFHADTVAPPMHVAEQRAGGPVDLKCVRLSRSAPLFNPTVSWSASGPRVLVNAGPGYDLWLHEGARPIARIRREVALRAPTLDDVREQYPEGYKVSFGGDRPPCVTPPEEVMRIYGVAESYPAVHDIALLSDGTMWVLRNPSVAAEPVVDVFASTGAYVGTLRGRQLPLGRLPNGELLIPRFDEDTGGWLLARVRVRQ